MIQLHPGVWKAIQVMCEDHPQEAVTSNEGIVSNKGLEIYSRSCGQVKYTKTGLNRLIQTFIYFRICMLNDSNMRVSYTFSYINPCIQKF